MTDIVLVAAVTRQGVIGHGRELVFRDPVDQRHFRTLTMGSPVLMGRKTWESLPERFRPLPGRRNIVISRQAGFAAAGAEVAPSLDAALQLAGSVPQVFVIGGAEIYALALPRAQRLVLTEVDADLPGDIRFPDWPRQRYTETARSVQTGSSGLPFAFVTYERRPEALAG